MDNKEWNRRRTVQGILLCFVLLLIASCTQTKNSPEEKRGDSPNTKKTEAIDRQALVARHTVVIENIIPLSPLSIGNGRFAFTADITGLQTFPQAYEKGLPLTTMAEWGWHSFANPTGYKLQDTFIDVQTGQRKVPYNINQKCPAGGWLRANPHQISLARIGFILKKADGSAAAVGDITDIHQELNLWTGLLTSSFKLEGKNVLVKTTCHPDIDNIAFEIQSELIVQKRLAVQIAFPYAAGTWGNDPADWTKPEKHTTELQSQSDTQLQVLHKMDELSLLHNDFRIQPLDPLAVWGRRLNSLFPKHLLFTCLYGIVFCQLIRQNDTSNLLKTVFSLIPTGITASPQLQQIMRSAYQRPLAATRFNSSPHKSVKAANILNLSKKRSKDYSPRAAIFNKKPATAPNLSHFPPFLSLFSVFL